MSAVPPLPVLPSLPPPADAGAEPCPTAHAEPSSTAAAPAAPAVLIVSRIATGTLLAGRYEVRGKIDDGAVASVYEARDTTTESRVALKILDPLRGADPVGQARFAREFEILSRLDHPGIARCLRRARHGELEILVLELIEGETLAARLERGRLPVEEAVRVAAQLAAALDCCHRADVLHRDLKPANIVLHPERGPVILDFGVAWFSSAANLTRTGALIGSPRYMAPEVFESSLCDARADLYAVGAMLFEMLAGRPVHFAESVAELAAAHRQQPPSLATIRPEAAALAPLVARAIAPRPEERFASAAELSRALARRQLARTAELQTRLVCPRCSTPLIIDLPCCPGCGRSFDWDLTAGSYAVELTAVPRPDETADWLIRRYGYALAISPRTLEARLRHLPLPLAVRASRSTAEQLAAEARQQRCTANVIRARAVIGAGFRAAAASSAEMSVAALLHGAAVLATGAGLLALGAGIAHVAWLPMAVGLLGVLAARWWARRPLLRCCRHRRDADVTGLPRLSRSLRRLRSDRARRLAAGAVARAAPVLLGGDQHATQLVRDDVDEALDEALEAAVIVDEQVALLEGCSRSRLAADLERAATRCELGEPGAAHELAQLRELRRELTEASLAHDLAARRALEAYQRISDAQLALTSPATVDPEAW